MNKQAYLEEAYNSAFNDELEKISSGGSAMAKHLRKVTGVMKPAPFGSGVSKMIDQPKYRKKVFDLTYGNPQQSISTHAAQTAKEFKEFGPKGGFGKMHSTYAKYYNAIKKARSKFKPTS